MAAKGLVSIELVGVTDLVALLRRYEDGAAALADVVVVVGTNLPYAYGQHQGRYRSGRLARRRGGTYFLTRALERVQSTIAPAVAAALPRGPVAAVRALLGRGHALHAEAGPLTPVRTGSLRRSLHTELARRR